VANTVYTAQKVSWLGTDVHSRVVFASDNIKVVLVDAADYTFSAAHEDLADIAAGARVATSGNLASKTTTAGAFDSADPTFTAVTGDVSEEIIMYKDSGTAATSPLVYRMDTFSSGMPVAPNGGDISIVVHASGWFSF
jgi:hypothetical protein